MKILLQTIVCISLYTTNCQAIEKNNKCEIITISKQSNIIALENQLINEYKLAQNDYELAEKFAKSFQKIIQENPETLNYSFKKLLAETNIYISSSSDGKLRIYSWDNNTGGTMRYFDQIIQLNDNGKINSKLKIASEDAQSYVSKIYSLKNKKKQTIYFTINNAIYSNSAVSQNINAYTISANNLVQAKAFKTKKKSLFSIDCPYDFFSVVDRPERPVDLIKIKNNNLYIPLINEKDVVTSKNLIYKWDGNIFKYQGIK